MLLYKRRSKYRRKPKEGGKKNRLLTLDLIKTKSTIALSEITIISESSYRIIMYSLILNENINEEAEINMKTEK